MFCLEEDVWHEMGTTGNSSVLLRVCVYICEGLSSRRRERKRKRKRKGKGKGEKKERKTGGRGPQRRGIVSVQPY